MTSDSKQQGFTESQLFTIYSSVAAIVLLSLTPPTSGIKLLPGAAALRLL